MNSVKRKIQSARNRGVYVFKMPAHLHRVRVAVERATHGRYTTRQAEVQEKAWAVYVEGEWYPRIGLSKREAANLAYAISVSKNVELEVTFSAIKPYCHTGERK